MNAIIGTQSSVAGNVASRGEAQGSASADKLLSVPRRTADHIAGIARERLRQSIDVTSDNRLGHTERSAESMAAITTQTANEKQSLSETATCATYVDASAAMIQTGITLGPQQLITTLCQSVRAETMTGTTLGARAGLAIAKRVIRGTDNSG
jgi:hypothetical protein